MAEIFDTRDASKLMTASRMARQAIAQGELIVLPTDTVYGVAADAFTPAAVNKLLDAKGRTRQSPPPVLVADIKGVRALADHVPIFIERIAERFWPGPLTVVLRANHSLAWDLGETDGTVALRIPDHEITLEILRETGPLAVSSANLTGEPAAVTAAEADAMLGSSTQVILDAGTSTGGVASTIIDATRVDNEGGVLRILRQGPITIEDLSELCPELTVAIASKASLTPPEKTETEEDIEADAAEPDASEATEGEAK